jgi:hypothetical protein
MALQNIPKLGFSALKYNWDIWADLQILDRRTKRLRENEDFGDFLDQFDESVSDVIYGKYIILVNFKFVVVNLYGLNSKSFVTKTQNIDICCFWVKLWPKLDHEKLSEKFFFFAEMEFHKIDSWIMTST